MTEQAKTAGVILAERICARLADIAQEMATDPLTTWSELREEFAGMTPNTFQVIYDLENYDGAVYPLIQNAVNENTNQFVKDTQGEYEFGIDTSDDLYVYNMIVFNPEECKNSKERYAALMVVQRFQSDVECISSRILGRLDPAGTMRLDYGAICVPNFSAFAYLVNPELGEHTLPERGFGRVDFSEGSIPPAPIPQPA